MKKLIPIIKTTMFCGMQNIPLRSHRHDGQLLTEAGKERIREGNFRALLKFRIGAGDKGLKSHLQSCGENASYISNTSKIAFEIKRAQFFTVIADETIDLSTQEQLSICIRYFDKKSLEIKEDFIKFIDVVDLSGENIAQKILDALEGLSIDITDLQRLSL